MPSPKVTSVLTLLNLLKTHAKTYRPGTYFSGPLTSFEPGGDHNQTAKMKNTFTRYEVFLIAILAFLQFTIILDFMVLSPLSAILLPELSITTAQFGMVVSAYAWSAGLSGLLAAGFADKFDRKKMLLFFYCGF